MYRMCVNVPVQCHYQYCAHSIYSSQSHSPNWHVDGSLSDFMVWTVRPFRNVVPKAMLFEYLWLWPILLISASPEDWSSPPWFVLLYSILSESGETSFESWGSPEGQRQSRSISAWRPNRNQVLCLSENMQMMHACPRLFKSSKTLRSTDSSSRGLFGTLKLAMLSVKAFLNVLNMTLDVTLLLLPLVAFFFKWGYIIW